MVLLGVGSGMLLPFIPLAARLGLTPLPAVSFLFLARMISTSFQLVEVVKRWLMRRSLEVPWRNARKSATVEERGDTGRLLRRTSVNLPQRSLSRRNQ